MRSKAGQNKKEREGETDSKHPLFEKKKARYVYAHAENGARLCKTLGWSKVLVLVAEARVGWRGGGGAGQGSSRLRKSLSLSLSLLFQHKVKN